MTDKHYDELLNFRTSTRFDGRQKAALSYTDAIVWNPDAADDAVWQELHAHFSIPEIVELGYFVALTLGQQRWIKTLDLHHHDLPADGEAGLASHQHR